MPMRLKMTVQFCLLLLALLGWCQISSAQDEGKQSLFYVRDGNIWLFDFKSGHERLVVEKGSAPSCSDDGKLIAFIRDGNIWIDNVSGGSAKKISNFSSAKQAIRSIEWLSINNTLVFSMNDEYELSYSGDKRKVVWPEDSYEAQNSKFVIRDIWMLSLDGKNLNKWIGNVPGSGTVGTKLSDVDSPKLARQGNMLVFSRNGDIWLATITDDDLSPINKKEKRLASVAYLENHYGGSGGSRFADHFSWTPDGKYIFFDVHRNEGSGFGEIWRMSINGKEVKKVLTPHEESFPQVSPDGKLLAFIQGFGLWISDIDGGAPRKLTDNIDMSQIAWCPID